MGQVRGRAQEGQGMAVATAKVAVVAKEQVGVRVARKEGVSYI